MSGTHHYFLPSVRLGLAASITQDASATHRAAVDVVLRATPYSLGDGPEASEPIPRTIQLYGPGDILGFDPRIVARTMPTHDADDFEPNYFPGIEFANADFLWRFTPGSAEEPVDDNGQQFPQLMPWVTLLVLVSESSAGDIHPEFEAGHRQDSNLPPCISVLTSALPRLEDAWRWVHVQITAEEGLSQSDVVNILREEPDRAVCRLLSARRLRPQTRYSAFVVPTFKLGVLAGLGLPLDASTNGLAPAWPNDPAQERLELPYYYHWEFGTGLRGDFEQLVRSLEPRQLSGLGTRDINCEHPGFGAAGVSREGLEAPDKHYLGMEGALQSLDITYTPWGQDAEDPSAPAPPQLQRDVARLINQLDLRIAETATIDKIQVVALPGEQQALVTWRTATPCTSRVDFGETSAYGDSLEDFELKRQHRIRMSPLTPERTYHFQISGHADDGTSDQTGDGQFRIQRLPVVVPPIYGRWHAVRKIVNADHQQPWIDVLNLDPRHRAAAGLGAEVVRQQQEALMASAWEQLGQIDSANDMLRHARLGRASSNGLYQRLAQLFNEDFLMATTPVHRRVLIEAPDSGQRITAAQYLRTRSRIPEAAFDPALRHMLRPRGSLRKRQSETRKRNLLARLASAQLSAADAPPKPLGTTTLCDITRRLITVTFWADPVEVTVGETATLHWRAANCVSCQALGGHWQGPRACTGDEQVGPFDEPGNYTFSLRCQGSHRSKTKSAKIRVTPQPVPSVQFWATPTETSVGQTATLQWLSRNCVSCKATGGDWEGSWECTGSVQSQEVGPFAEPGTYAFSITCKGVDANTTATVEVTVTKKAPVVYVRAVPGPEAATLRVRWSARNCISCSAYSSTVVTGWQGEGWPCSGAKQIGPLPSPGRYTLCLECQGPGGTTSECVSVLLRPDGSFQFGTTPTDDAEHRFCDGRITCEQIQEEIRNRDPFPDLDQVPDPEAAAGIVCHTLNTWLEKPPLTETAEPPVQPASFVDHLRDILLTRLDPARTIVARTQGRIHLKGDLSQRFAADAGCDPLDAIMSGPTFPQPMYEPLRDISHQLLLPGVEKLPQNTIGILRTNRRFLESYMCGCNHALASELLWRGYPTDQRGSYFRQFWDAGDFVPLPAELDELLDGWLDAHDAGSVAELSAEQRERILRRHEDEVGDVSELNEAQILELITDLIKHEGLQEYLRDITPLVSWRNRGLGQQRVRPDEGLVLVVRGDLLKRYPHALIYAVGAVSDESGELVPALPEYGFEGEPERIFPLFRVTLPPDLTFFGFAFGQEQAVNEPGKFFIIEEPVAEPLFGLDAPVDPPPPLDDTWDALSWSHFGFGLSGGSQHYGAYLDEPPNPDPPSAPGSHRNWANSSSATRAWMTMQKPVRVAIHARQMLPQN